MALFYFFLVFFNILSLYSPCVARFPFSYFVEQSSTTAAYRSFRTLWRPYTQFYTLMFLHQSPILDIDTTTRRTIHVTIDGNLRTPYFMKDYYYDERPLSIRTKIFYLKEMSVKTLATENFEKIVRQGSNNATSGTTKGDISSNNTTSENTIKTSPEQPTAACYVCGLNVSGIPDSSCYDVFDSPDFRFIHLQAHYKKNCYKGSPKQEKRKWYGNLYRDGCFKRFLDVGFIYNERGCRERKPYVGNSFASKRFGKLEKLLYGRNEGCVFSPYAVLTPFSKAISLYARYHVCVCQGKYCNRATKVVRFFKIIWIIPVTMILIF